MDSEQLKKSILQFPALLQYSVTTLRSKLIFFTEYLNIKDDDLVVKLLVSKPMLCGLSRNETGEVFSRVPALLLLSWHGKLEPKLTFLMNRLGLNHSELRNLVLSSPIALTYSLHLKLSPAIDFVEDQLSKSPALNITAKDLLLKRPSLVRMDKEELATAIGRMEPFDKDLQDRQDEFRFLSNGRKNVVLELSQNGTVMSEFASVKDAAASVGRSVSYMYHLISRSKVFRGRKYFYGGRMSQQDQVGSTTPSETGIGAANIVSAKSKTSHASDVTEAVHMETKGCRLSVYVSGRVYPPDNKSTARGVRRAGGMAIAMPALSGELSAALEHVLNEDFRPQLLGFKSCQVHESEKGLVALIGYTNLGPSRRRCGLYSCFIALRIVTQLYMFLDKRRRSQSLDEGSCPPMPRYVDIITDSDYVYNLLKDKDQLWEWGSAQTLEEFKGNVRGSKKFANTDIVYTLSRAHHKLVDPNGGVASALNTSIAVSFCLSNNGQTSQIEASQFCEEMNRFGIESAKLFYERSFIADMI
jgi:mTERF